MQRKASIEAAETPARDQPICADTGCRNTVSDIIGSDADAADHDTDTDDHPAVVDAHCVPLDRSAGRITAPVSTGNGLFTGTAGPLPARKGGGSAALRRGLDPTIPSSRLRRIHLHLLTWLDPLPKRSLESLWTTGSRLAEAGFDNLLPRTAALARGLRSRSPRRPIRPPPWWPIRFCESMGAKSATSLCAISKDQPHGSSRTPCAA